MTTRDVSTPAWILAALILTTPAGPGHASQEAAPAPGGIRDQFEIVLPEGWSSYDQTEAVTGKPAALGMVIFSAEPLAKEGAATPDKA
jgi:hypothetical protein